MKTTLLIALAGAVGTLARYGLATATYSALGTAFPWGTFVVNILGCLVFGVVMQAGLATTLSTELRTLLTVGFLGAFTTFSTFSYETLTRIQDGQWLVAGMNAGGSVVCGLGAAWLGMALARAVWGGA